MSRATCPTPYKHAFPTTGEALLVRDDMKRRAKRSKQKYSPVEPYRCPCGAVHLASAYRVRNYGRAA